MYFSIRQVFYSSSMAYDVGDIFLGVPHWHKSHKTLTGLQPAKPLRFLKLAWRMFVIKLLYEFFQILDIFDLPKMQNLLLGIVVVVR